MQPGHDNAFLPSYQTVIAQNRASSLRLPSYQHKHGYRYHPYPILAPRYRLRRIPFDEEFPEPYAMIVNRDVQAVELATNNLAAAMEQQQQEPRYEDDQEVLNALILDLAHAIQRRLNGMCVVNVIVIGGNPGEN